MRRAALHGVTPQQEPSRTWWRSDRVDVLVYALWAAVLVVLIRYV